MRTRRSNRTKSYTFKSYDLSGSSDEEDQTQRSPRIDDAENGDFDGAAEQIAEDESNELSSIGDADLIDETSREHVKPAETTDYLDIELAPTEGQHKGYVGPYERGMRGKALARVWYGPQEERIDKAHRLLERWRGWTVLPPKVVHGEVEPTDLAFWTPQVFEKEAQFAEKWWTHARPALAHDDNAWAQLPLDESALYEMSRSSMPVLIGPHDAQQEVIFQAGSCYSLSHNGLPFDVDSDANQITSGWLLDVGGVVLGMDWMPQRHRNPRQLLAMAVVPHSDQEYYNFQQACTDSDFQKHGVVQIWEFPGTMTDEGFIRPSAENAVRLRTLCFEFGRVRKVRWGPTYSHLAMLCGDGSVCVVDVGDLKSSQQGGYYKLQKPLALLRLSDEYSIKATTMVWVNCNRIAAGYSDGSIALWSIYPCRLLSRHAVHHNSIIDMASGYPTKPTLIASIPVGGAARLIDIQAPSYETTEVQKPLVHTQPGMLAWSDHMLGFVSTYPSANVLNTVVGFLHHAHFPIARRVFTGDSFINCLAMGRLHPFLLVGAADGSLWSLNAQTELFSARHEATDRLRVLQHEHRSAGLFPLDSPAAARGAARILQGFTPEKNRNIKGEARLAAKRGGKLRRPNVAEEDDEAADLTDPSRAVLHEPLTRVTAMEWNPNEDYGCWAAVAMGSGLVRVIDLGLEQFPGETK